MSELLLVLSAEHPRGNIWHITVLRRWICLLAARHDPRRAPGEIFSTSTHSEMRRCARGKISAPCKCAQVITEQALGAQQRHPSFLKWCGHSARATHPWCHIGPIPPSSVAQSAAHLTTCSGAVFFFLPFFPLPSPGDPKLRVTHLLSFYNKTKNLNLQAVKVCDHASPTQRNFPKPKPCHRA